MFKTGLTNTEEHQNRGGNAVYSDSGREILIGSGGETSGFTLEPPGFLSKCKIQDGLPQRVGGRCHKEAILGIFTNSFWVADGTQEAVRHL